MPPRPNNEFYQSQDARNQLHAALQNSANQAGASITAGNRGGIKSESGYNAYKNEAAGNRVTPAPTPTGYKADAGGPSRFYTQAEANALPMGGERDMALIERNRMTIPDREREYEAQQAQNVHSTPELKPNPETQNRPIRTTPYEHLPEHTQHNLRQVFGENFHDTYNQADPRFRKYLSGLVQDFGVRNAAEIVMNPDHPRNMMHTFKGKPGKDGSVADPAWLTTFQQNGVSNPTPTGLKAPQYDGGRISHPAQAQPTLPAAPTAPVKGPGLSSENTKFLNDLQSRYDARMAAHAATPRSPQKPLELNDSQQQMAQNLQAAKGRIERDNDIDFDAEGYPVAKPAPVQPKPVKPKDYFGANKAPKPNPLSLDANTAPPMPKPPGMVDGSLAAKLGSMSGLSAKPFVPTRAKPSQPPTAPQQVEAPQPVQAKPITPKRPGLLGGLRRRR